MHCLSFQLKQLMANKPLLGLGITHWSKPVFGRVKSESITIWPEPNYSSVRKALFILASKPINLQATARSIGVCLCACACACVYLISQGPRVKYDLNTYCTWRQNGDSQQTAGFTPFSHNCLANKNKYAVCEYGAARMPAHYVGAARTC